MSGAAKSETIRIRIEPNKKAALTAIYAAQGTTISAAARAFLDAELAAHQNPLDAFDAIMASADAKLDAYGAPEPTVDDIVNFVDAARQNHAAGAVACKAHA
jgi:antitoxin component of RelBE/YafQ-DinJ toxin-antitoxin module